jgi:malate dehydrogenase (oxaloacetate-decarboxylating)
VLEQPESDSGNNLVESPRFEARSPAAVLSSVEASQPEPGPSYSITMRIQARSSTTLLPELSRTVGAAGGVVVAVDLVGVEPGSATVDLTFHARDETHVEIVAAAIADAGYEVRHISDRTFLYHLGGTISVVPKSPIRTRDDLSLAYTPGVGRIASAIAQEPAKAWNLTVKGNSVAIVTNGSAVLGLGNLGPLAALPVMEGKAALFKTFANIDAYPICLDATSADEIVAATKAIAPGFGGINLEDIAAPICFEVERRLQDLLDIPVFHDDQHGTAIVVLAALVNACRIRGTRLADTRVVVVGVGAAGHAISEALLEAGVGDLIAVDVDGPLDDTRKLLPHHAELAKRTNRGGFRTLEDAMHGADAFVGVARRGSVDQALFQTMAKRPVIFALSNPYPEAMPDEVPDDAILATGRSDLPNQVNNALCFPGMFRGSLDARARRISVSMKHAAARAIADAVSEDERSIGVVIPALFNAEVHQLVARAVQRAANETLDGLNRVEATSYTG